MTTPMTRPVSRPERAVLLVFVAAKLAVHLAFGGGYGIFRDELYYLACADHLAWGYVDHPPLVAVFAAVARAVFGTSTFGLRFLPAVAGAAIVALTWALARKLGGGVFAQALGCACVLAAPELLGTHSFLSMNVLEHLSWIATTYILVRGVADERPRVLLWLGPVVGLGLLDKHSMAWLAAALAIGLLATPERKWLAKKEVAIAAAIALLLFLPHVLWQVRNGFPTLEFMQNAQEKKNVHMPFFAFWKSVTDGMNMLSAPVWIAGLVGVFVRKELARWRFLGIATLLVFALVTWQKGKTYYLAPAFPALFAAGGVVIERVLGERARRVKWIVLAPILAMGAAAAPFALPILPPYSFRAYAKKMGADPAPAERSELGELPQFFADRFGWREMNDAVRAVYAALPAEERARAAILARNYGEASATRFFGPPGEGARVLSTHNAYYMWGYGEPAPEVLVTIGYGRERLEREFEDVREASRFSHPLTMPYESDNPIFVCRRPKRAFSEIWRSYKIFI